MFRSLRPLIVLLLSGIATPSLATAQDSLPPYVPKGSKIGFADAIATFEKQDKDSMPPSGGILFIGSSIFRQWEQLTAQMAPLPVFNRAFGGSKTWEVLHYAERVVLPYKPRLVVYYCGSNDVKGKHPAGEIIARIRAFNAKVHAALPETKILFTSIHRAPDKRARWAVVDSVNNAIAADAAASGGRLGYIDLNPVLFDRAGNIRGELFRPDSLHFVPAAYVEFTAVVKPALEREWAAMAGRSTRK